MQEATSRPETEGSATDPAAAVDRTTRQPSQADLALVFAVVAPLAIIGLLVLVGFGLAVAICITFVVASAGTMSQDVRWFLHRRRLRNDSCRSQS